MQEKLKNLVRDLSPDSPEYKRYIRAIVTQGIRSQQQTEASRILDKQLQEILKGI